MGEEIIDAWQQDDGTFTPILDKYNDTQDERRVINLLKQITPIYHPKQKRLDEFERQKLLPVIIKKKQQYPQNYKAYDNAKTNEPKLLKKLLDELLFLVLPTHIPKKGGGYSLKDKLFCLCMKEYYDKDLRFIEGQLKEFKDLGYIEKVPCYKSICNFNNDEELISHFDKLILISSLPVAMLEKTGGIDATGFGTRKYEAWSHFRRGKHTGKERIFRKAHIFYGCKTNIIVSVKVTQGNVADPTMVQEVIGNKTFYFDMEDFVGDKAYSSREILDFLYRLGLTPFIPFKSNATGSPKGFLVWRKMFDFFQNQREEFDNRYHLRSNCESTNHMLKQNFGETLFTKNFIANQSQIYAKALVHNLSVLIQESLERGIDIDFDACVKKVNPV